jgi:hypothetical protein
MNIRPIETDADLEAALARIDQLSSTTRSRHPTQLRQSAFAWSSREDRREHLLSWLRLRPIVPPNAIAGASCTELPATGLGGRDAVKGGRSWEAAGAAGGVADL